MIHVAFNIDDSYVKYCAVTLTSLFENNLNEQFSAYILGRHVSADGERLLRRVAEKYHQQVFIYPIEDKLISHFPSLGPDSHISLATYLRLFLSDVVPPETNKVLYLDCDLLVNGPIADLWNIDLTNHSVGCVEDQWSGVAEKYELLDYHPRYSYFNAGVMLVNLDYWRNHRLVNRFTDYVATHADKLQFADQDVLNAVLHESKLLIPMRWNLQDGFLRRKRKLRPNADLALRQELDKAVIIHFTGSKKPWQYNSLSPYRRLYFKYLDLTEWKGERPSFPLTYRFKRMVDKLLFALRLKPHRYRPLRNLKAED